MDTCKICGAARDPLNTNCKFCGTAYALEKITGETYIAGLSAILQTIEKGAADERSKLTGQVDWNGPGREKAIAQSQASAISTFAMPSDVENLLQFLAFCHGNAQVPISFGDLAADRLKSAWHGKAKMAFTQLKMKSIANPTLTPYIAEYEPLYGVSVKTPSSAASKNLKRMAIIGGLLFIGLIVAGVIAGIVAVRMGNSQERKLEQVTLQVQNAVASGNYDAALILAEGIRWTFTSETNKIAAYDTKREALKLQLTEMKKAASERK